MLRNTLHSSRRNLHSSARLNILIFLGSTRAGGPPKPYRVGERVTRWVEKELSERGHTVKTFDPRNTPLVAQHKPHFSYERGDAPRVMNDLAGKIRRADAFIMCTPEYNHGPAPALLSTLAHFGSSLFAFKPSAIVSYSQSQFGGVRAAAGLVPVLSHLGCLPVSSMVHIPRAQSELDSQGVLTKFTENEWTRHAARTWHELEWWALAAAKHREVVDPLITSPRL